MEKSWVLSGTLFIYLFLKFAWIHFFILQRGKKETRIVAAEAMNKLSG